MAESNNQIVRPFLKWAGGKKQLRRPIINAIRQTGFNRYYEPFVGGGAILFALQSKNCPVINDLNKQLIITYETIKNHVDELIEELQIHKMKNCKEYYYEMREMDRQSDFEDKLKNDPVAIASRLIYLNKTCYNGLYRVNSYGFFNTPYGRYENPTIYDEEVLRAINNYFVKSKIVIRNGNFDKATKGIKKGDFIYFDPPYDSPNCTNFTGYQANKFDREQQEKLRDLAIKLTDKGVKCLLSNADTEYIRELFNDRDIFEISTVKAKRMIGSNADTRRAVNEVLIKNYGLDRNEDW